MRLRRGKGNFETKYMIMKNKILCAIAVVAMVAGCARMREHMGGTSDTHATVLTGGPTTGVTLKDLPHAVKNTLKEQVPAAEVATIDKETQNGQTVYRITFTDPTKFPTMSINKDGTVSQQTKIEQPTRTEEPSKDTEKPNK
jgi:hypothetical protein